MFGFVCCFVCCGFMETPQVSHKPSSDLQAAKASEALGAHERTHLGAQGTGYLLSNCTCQAVRIRITLLQEDISGW